MDNSSKTPVDLILDKSAHLAALLQIKYEDLSEAEAALIVAALLGAFVDNFDSDLVTTLVDDVVKAFRIAKKQQLT